MSSSVTTKAPTHPQRVTHAAETVAQYLHLDDAKRVSAALAEIAAEEAARNAGFALRVRSRYDELAAPSRRRSGSTRVTGPKPPKRILVPLKIVETGEVNIGAALDPYRLYDIYGADQLADALREHATASLKEAVEFVQERHPGTKPKNKGQRESIIQYLVNYVMKDH